MLQAVVNGVLLGLLISVLIGPVFFLLIEISIKEGFRSALFMDAGIILSDAACIFVAYFGMAALLEEPRNKFIFVLVGSGVLLIMGILKLIPPKPKTGAETLREFQVKRSNPFWLAAQGFLYNLLNPSTIIFWITCIVISFFAFVKRFSLIPLLGLGTCLYLLTGMTGKNWAWFSSWLVLGLIVRQEAVMP